MNQLKQLWRILSKIIVQLLIWAALTWIMILLGYGAAMLFNIEPNYIFFCFSALFALATLLEFKKDFNNLTITKSLMKNLAGTCAALLLAFSNHPAPFLM